MKWLVALFIALFPAIASAEDVRFTASPKATLAFPNKPAVITLRVVITDATEKLWCPEVEWDWPDGTKSVEESDCAIYEEADPADIRYQSWTKRVTVSSGEWNFQVRLNRSGKTIKKLNVTVNVGGE